MTETNFIRNLAIGSIPALYVASALPSVTSLSLCTSLLGTFELYVLLLLFARCFSEASPWQKTIKIYSMGILFSIGIASVPGSIALLFGVHTWALGITAFFLLVMLYGMIFGLRRVVTRRFELFLATLPVAFDGYKLFFFSDLHAGTYVSKKPLKKVHEIHVIEKPDLTVFDGDFINGRADELLPFAAILKDFGLVYAILGNHDYGDYVYTNEHEKEHNMQKLLVTIESFGWKLLRNEHTIITKGGESIALIGVENWGKKKNMPKLADLDKAVKGVEDVQFKILMTHDPSHVDEEVVHYPLDFHLMLSGHTHGMQCGYRFDGEGSNQGKKWSPAKYVQKHWGGLYYLKNTKTSTVLTEVISTGIGVLGYLSRIGMTPEVTILTLRCKK